MTEKPAMGVRLATQNDCYRANRTIVPRGIVVHSTGANNPYLHRYVGPDDGVLGPNQYGNHWNQPGVKKCMHAFIGKAQSGRPMIYQTLPWQRRAWGVGSGKKGSYNDTHIQFEICEDGLTNGAYWQQVRHLAVKLCAWLCQEYNMPVQNVVGHFEAHAAGYANNHGDPGHWMKKQGDHMAAFRADVAETMASGGATEDGPPTDPTQGGEPMATLYQATVRTKNNYPNGSIGLYANTDKTLKLADVKDNQVVAVLAEVNATWAQCQYNGLTGYCDRQYLVKVAEAVPQPPFTGSQASVVILCESAEQATLLQKLLANAAVQKGA